MDNSYGGSIMTKKSDHEKVREIRVKNQNEKIERNMRISEKSKIQIGDKENTFDYHTGKFE